MLFPVDSVPDVLNGVANVNGRDTVPLVVTTNVKLCPAIPPEGVIVQLWPGVKIKLLPLSQFISTLDPGVNDISPPEIAPVTCKLGVVVTILFSLQLLYPP